MSQGQRSANEPMILAGMLLLMAGAAGYAIWYIFHEQLTEVIRWVRWAELWVDKLLVGDAYVSPDDPAHQPIVVWRNWLRHAPVQNITVDHIGAVSASAVLPLRPVFAVILVIMSGYVIFFGHGTHYKRRMRLEQLMAEQAKSFPSIQPFLKFDPRTKPFRVLGQAVPAQLPAFAEALAPEEWIAYNEITVKDGRIDYARTFAALASQLGRRWEGPLSLPVYAQGLFAAFALKHARKRKESEDLLNQLSTSWSAEKGFKPSPKLKSHIRSVIKDPKLGGNLQKYADSHAYETTAMLRALSRARDEGGVLAPAQFLWLRGVDRALWYPLNNLGRRAYHAEAAGAMVHYTNELIANQKIPTPRFDDVIRVIEDYLKENGGRSIPALDKKAARG